MHMFSDVYLSIHISCARRRRHRRIEGCGGARAEGLRAICPSAAVMQYGKANNNNDDNTNTTNNSVNNNDDNNDNHDNHNNNHD